MSAWACSVTRAVAVLVFLATSVFSAPGSALALVHPGDLVARLRDLPGFGTARVTHLTTTSIAEWVQANSNTPAEVAQETTELTQGGFQLGVQAFFVGRRESHGKQREAVSDAVVLATPTAAAHAINVQVVGALKGFGKAGRLRGRVHSIPGSVTLGNFVPGKRGATGNVFFSLGRCAFVVGDFVHDATTRSIAARRAVAAAEAIYKRARASCV